MQFPVTVSDLLPTSHLPQMGFEMVSENYQQDHFKSLSNRDRSGRNVILRMLSHLLTTYIQSYLFRYRTLLPTTFHFYFQNLS